jgi:predicted O-linked N-acetylglucosamine transferase (SPINDLY family)
LLASGDNAGIAILRSCLMGSELNAALFAESMRLAKEGQLAAAESRLRQCLESLPTSTMLLGNLAALLIMQRKYADARICIEQVLAIDANIAEAWLNLGIIEEEERSDFEAALKNFDAALRLRANYPEAHYNRGNMLARMYRLEEALASYRQAIKLAPGYVDALHNLANTLRSARQPELALEAFSAAIKLKPSADLYANRGYALRDVGQYQAAIKSFDKALQLDAASPECRGIRLHSKAQICDWSQWHGQLEEMTDSIVRGELASPPFCVLHLVDSGPLQRQIAELWTERNHPGDATLSPAAPGRGDGLGNSVNHRPLRVGYFSADFHDHPVANFVINLIEHHDKSKVESIGFSFDVKPSDAMRERLVKAFDQFHDVSQQSDRSIAELARKLGVDIAIDLGGHTANGRPGIFALRAAPIQVSYLGHPGTMGASYMDYLLADAVVTPKENSAWYSESIVALPNLYTNADAHRASPGSVTRSDYQLPDAAFVYCCFNNTWKYDPLTFQCWMEILKATSTSVLFLLESHPLVATNLRAEARKAGVDPKRLVFGARVPKDQYLARFLAADLFLDTFPYSAGTTALDALSMGLPLLTLQGDSFASRLASSVLATFGLEDLVTTTRADYQALAIELARSPQLLARLKVRLADQARTSSAFNAARYARHVEQAYFAMHARLKAGLAPGGLQLEV